VHATGGGGELGPNSRVSEGKLSEIIDAGITTVCGLLGTDSLSRSEENLLTKLTSLEVDGLTTYMWSGAYHVPTPSLTGSTIRDMMLINKVIGLGEIAVSDQRSSVPSFDELARLISDARVGGMLSGKAGKVQFHMGSGKKKLYPLFDIVENTDIPITQIYPTHMSGRGQELLDQGKLWVSQGGYIDFTADGINGTHTLNAIIYFSKSYDYLTRVTVSSDSYGSLPKFDSGGNVIGYDYGRPDVLIKTFKNLVLNYNWTIDKAVQFYTINPAKYLSFKKKGELKVGNDPDIVVLNKDNLNIEYVIGKGKYLKTPTWTKQPMFPCL